MKIINNIQENSHLSVLIDFFRKSEEVFITVAFFKKSGLNLIIDEIKKALERQVSITLVCGLDFYQTEPEALKLFYALTQKYSKCKLLVHQHKENITFHPKIYCFSNKSETNLIIGSANFTQGGFKTNFEVSTISVIENNSKQHRELQILINAISKKSVEYTDIEISNYARKYQIYKRNENNARKESKIETEAVFKLDKELLEDYLRSYLSDDKEKLDFERRTNNYLEAKKILEIIRTNNLDKDTFFNYYERLVGKAGEKSLWHSGSIFRGKESVKKYHSEFKDLLNEVYFNLNKKPKEILKRIEKFYKAGSSDKIGGIGPNIVTEILNTYSPEKYGVLNQNPLTSIKFLGFEEFPHSQSFKPINYQDFTSLLAGLKNICQFESLGQVDHFLNYIYWQEKNKAKDDNKN